jgi:hypothetical protein
MCVNGKLDLLKLFQESGRVAIKENGGGSEFNYDIFDIL